MKIHDRSYVDLIDHMGDDLRIVEAARVSFDRTVDGMDDRGPGLIRYLARNQHWTPFGHVVITLRLTMPVFVARQWMRSNVGTVRNELSRRYVDTPPEYYLPAVLHGRPDGSIKQGAGGDHYRSPGWLRTMKSLYADCHNVYLGMVAAGVAPEEARLVLPLGHMTSMIETGSIAYFARVVKLRVDGHAQGATRDLAELVSAAVAPVAPLAWLALLGDAPDNHTGGTR